MPTPRCPATQINPPRQGGRATLGRLGGLSPNEADCGENALSGDGYRAALFHLGALTRLNELGLLEQIGTIGAVSGGASSRRCWRRGSPGRSGAPAATGPSASPSRCGQ